MLGASASVSTGSFALTPVADATVASGKPTTNSGTATNLFIQSSSTSAYGVSVGNTGITSADTLTVNGTGGLSNTGEINIEGSATAQATLDVANAAAGFGTAGVETGTVYLQNDALLEFQSGQIASPNHSFQHRGHCSSLVQAPGSR